jgi:RNA polymerase sigma-B factor
VSPDKRVRGLDTDELFRRYHDDPDPAIQEELARRFAPLAHQLARRYDAKGEPLEDLDQVATLGLLKAISTFDPGRGFAFSSYATPTILGELKRHFRDSSWAVHVPRATKERALELGRATDRLSSRLGRSPSISELAEALEISEEQALDAIEAYHARYAAPLDGPPEAGEEARQTFRQTLGSEDEQLELTEYLAVIAQGVESLPESARMVLYLRFARDLTQVEIAQRMGVSQMQVSRLLRSSITTIREASGEQNPRGAP